MFSVQRTQLASIVFPGQPKQWSREIGLGMLITATSLGQYFAKVRNQILACNCYNVYQYRFAIERNGWGAKHFISNPKVRSAVEAP
jgi:hypothetical protein